MPIEKDRHCSLSGYIPGFFSWMWLSPYYATVRSYHQSRKSPKYKMWKDKGIFWRMTHPRFIPFPRHLLLVVRRSITINRHLIRFVYSYKKGHLTEPQSNCLRYYKATITPMLFFKVPTFYLLWLRCSSLQRLLTHLQPLWSNNGDMHA